MNVSVEEFLPGGANPSHMDELFEYRFEKINRGAEYVTASLPRSFSHTSYLWT